MIRVERLGETGFWETWLKLIVFLPVSGTLLSDYTNAHVARAIYYLLNSTL